MDKIIMYAKKNIKKGDTISVIKQESGDIVSKNANFLPHGKNKIRYLVNNKIGWLAHVWYFLNKRRTIWGM